MHNVTAEADRYFHDVQYHAGKAIDFAQARAEQDVSLIMATSRQYTDNIAERCETQWNSILSDATVLSQRLDDESARHYTDVQHYARKMLDAAETASRETIAAVLAYGVTPTLRRGFAIVQADGKPVSSKAAASMHQRLEVVFHDGTINVRPKGE